MTKWDYVERGLRRLQGRPIEDGFRAPGFEVFLSWLIAAFDSGSATLRMANAAVSSVIVLPMYGIGRRLGGIQLARAAALVAALFPPFVAYGHLLWTESIDTIIGLCALLLTEKALTDSRALTAAFAGLLWAALMLTREVAVAALATVLGYLLLRRTSALLRPGFALPFLLAAVVPVAAWSSYLNADNGPQDGHSLISRTTYLNLYIGNGPTAQVRAEHPGLSPRRHYESLARTRAAREALAKPRVWQIIREAGPTWLLSKTEVMVPRFFSPGGFPVRRLLIADTAPKDPWAYKGSTGQPLNRSLAHALAIAYVSTLALTFLCGTAGLCLLSPTSPGLLGLWLAFGFGHLWPTVFTFATTRFAVPALPLFVLGAANLMLRPHLQWRGLSTPRKVLLILTTVTMAWILFGQLDRALSAAWL